MILRIAKERFNTFMIAVSKPQQCTSSIVGPKANTIHADAVASKKSQFDHNRAP